MKAEIFSVQGGGGGLELPATTECPVHEIDNRSNISSPCLLYQGFLELCKSDIVVYTHDDLAILDYQWESKVASVFHSSSNIVCVGLGGATSLGTRDLYRKPYHINQMARGGYGSNQVDAETHGIRFTGVRRVAVLDAFFMAVRTSWLRSIGGWPTRYLTHHCLDLWLACEAARHGKEIWMVGAECNHYGGGTSITPSYSAATWLQGGTVDSDHAIPHRWLYDTYRDVLPLQL